jgi:serine/threonine-protein kinase
MQESLPGSIGAYRVITKLGEGGMAKVYLGMALKGRFRKLVVIKLLNAECSRNPEAREMFVEEAELAARLNHPNVVSTFEVGDDELGQFMAMEYLEGQSYAAVVRKVGRGKLALEHHLEVLVDALAGLHYAHEFVDYDGRHLGIVHRDVTPQNVFVTYDGQVKLVDFGVAKAACQSHETRAGVIKGKLAYLAPEQATGHSLDRRADLFGVGVMLWEALSGRRFSSGAIDVAIIHNRIHGLEPRIRAVVPDAPPELADICDRAMAVDPEARFTTAREFQEALKNALESSLPQRKLPSLASVVSEAFAAERTEVRSIVEQHSRSHSDAGLETTKSLIRAPARPDGEAPPAPEPSRELTETNAIAGVPEPRPIPARRARWLPWTAIALLGVVASALVWRGRTPEPGAPAIPPGAPPASATSTKAAAMPSVQPDASAALVDLAITATPSEATLTLDGVALGVNPYRGKIARDGRLRVVRASAPGYAAAERSVRMDADVGLELTLARAVAVTKGTSFAAAEAQPVVAAAPTTPTSAAPSVPTTAQAGDDLRPIAKTSKRTVDEKDPYSP